MDKSFSCKIWPIFYVLLIIISLHHVFASPCYVCKDAKIYTNDDFTKAVLKSNSDLLQTSNCHNIDKHSPTSVCISQAGSNPYIDDKCGTYTGKINITIIDSISLKRKFLIIDGIFRQCVGVPQSYKNQCYKSATEIQHIMESNLYIYKHLKSLKTQTYSISKITGELCLCEGEFCNNDCDSGFWIQKNSHCLKYWVIGLIVGAGVLLIIVIAVIIVCIIKRSRGKTPTVQPNTPVAAASMTRGIALTNSSSNNPPKHSNQSVSSGDYVRYGQGHPPPYNEAEYETLGPRY